MSILGSILGSIFGRAQAEPTASARSSSGAPGSFQAPASGQQSTISGSQQGGQTAGHVGPGNIPFAPRSASQPVDVEPLLDGMAAKNKQKLDWRHSIVDLMKLLDLDSGLPARKELAKELNYTGDMDDSAAMNIWLHKQVMRKLADNGGKVPEDLKN